MIDEIRRVAVVGAGYMGGGIAQSLAVVGLDVVIADRDPDLGAAARERLLADTARFEQQGMWPTGSVERVREHLRAAATPEEAVADVDFIEEAVFEEVAVKHDVLARVSAAARPDAIIGSNTSTIPVSVLATAVARPERFLTVHWSNPAPFIPGVELVLGDATDPAVVAPVKRMLQSAGRQSATVADRPGFVLNRLQYALLAEACAIVEEGVASVEDVDTIVRSTFGFRLPFFGPFAIADMAGLDVYEKGFGILREGLGERFAEPALIRDAVARGAHGLKNGAGLTGGFDEDRADRYVDYRTEAYGRLAGLLAELGSPDAPRPDAG